VVVPDHFQVPPEWTVVTPGVEGWHLWYVDETGSTNADLLSAAASGAPDRTVLATGHQTAGRGRLDRRWEAPPGRNLLMSMLLRNGTDRPQQLTRRLGVAASRACRALAGVEPTIKWPNDLLLDDCKLAGILAQATPAGDGVVVGIGLNVGWAPDGAARLGDHVRPDQLLAQVLVAFDEVDTDVRTDVDSEYRRLLDTLGRRVRVERQGDDLVGRAVDIDVDGHLVVIDECAISHRVDAGDVIHLRSADEA